MDSVGFTGHALARLQGRGIPIYVVELLETYGSEIRCAGADRMIFDRKATVRLRRALSHKDWRLVERWLKVYVVMSEFGTIMTVAHQIKRHNRE